MKHGSFLFSLFWFLWNIVIILGWKKGSVLFLQKLLVFFYSTYFSFRKKKMGKDLESIISSNFTAYPTCTLPIHTPISKKRTRGYTQYSYLCRISCSKNAPKISLVCSVCILYGSRCTQKKVFIFTFCSVVIRLTVFSLWKFFLRLAMWLCLFCLHCIRFCIPCLFTLFVVFLSALSVDYPYIYLRKEERIHPISDYLHGTYLHASS